MAGAAEYICKNGEIIPWEQAVLHVMSPTVRYGANVFEGIRGYWNEEKGQMYIFKIEEHLKRLQQSIKMMKFDASFDIEAMKTWVLELIRKNQLREDIHIRPQVVIHGQVGGVDCKGPISIFISAVPMGRFLPEQGVNARVSSWRRIDDDVIPARIKCAANYQNARFSLIEAKEAGYDATIMLNKAGKVTEEARACLFVCRDDIPMTPPVTNGILESITRKTLLQLFRDEMGLAPVEREIDRTELYIAEEAFFCGSGAEVTPILSVDGYELPGGPLTSEIKKIYFEIALGKTDKGSEWRTPVY